MYVPIFGWQDFSFCNYELSKTLNALHRILTKGRPLREALFLFLYTKAMDVRLFFMLLAGHYVADYGLQTQFMAENKGKAFVTAIGFHSLAAHAAIHGLMTGLITQNFWAGVFVAASHWLIDFGKASVLLTDKFPHTKGARKNGQKAGLYGINIDQSLHVLILALVVWLR